MASRSGHAVALLHADGLLATGPLTVARASRRTRAGLENGPSGAGGTSSMPPPRPRWLIRTEPLSSFAGAPQCISRNKPRRSSLTGSRIFWHDIMKNVKQKYQIPPIDQLFTSDSQASTMPNWPSSYVSRNRFGPRVSLLGADQIDDAGPEYLLPGTLVQDIPHVFAGLPNQGKSTLLAAMASTLSNERIKEWMGKPGIRHGTVVIFNSEDSNGVLRRRLEAAGADLRNVKIIQGYRELQGKPEQSFSTKDHGELLKLELKSIANVVAIFFDNIEGLLGGFGRSNEGVRNAFSSIKSIVPPGCAIIGLTHFRKDFDGRDPLGSILGSSAISQVVRLVWATRKIDGETAPDGSPLYALVREKVIDGARVGSGRYYSIEGVTLADHRETSRIVWHDEFEKLPEESNKSSSNERSSSQQLMGAAEFLFKHLSSGPKRVTNMEAAAREIGISKRTLERVRSRFSIPRFKSTLDQSWWIALPGMTQQQFKNFEFAGYATPPASPNDAETV